MRPAAPSRVLLTTDCVGGVWRFSSGLAEALAAAGAEVTLVTLGPAPSVAQAGELSQRIELIVTDFALEWMDPTGRDLLRTHEGLADIAADVQPDVVHLGSYRDALARWRAPVVITAHSCVETWFCACRGGPPEEDEWSIYADNVRRGLDAAAAWTAPTRAFCRDVEAIYRLRRPGIPIHNGSVMQDTICPKRPFILSAGRLWDEAKNIGALTSIAASLPWTVCIAGDTGSRPTSKAGLRNVVVCGKLQHSALRSLMSAAGIYAAPARYEPFGLAILEAAQSGCALVLGATATLRELWEGAAIFVDPDRESELRDALEHLCNDDAARRRLQRAAPARAPRNSKETMLHQ
jgi:glycosyltransferase involved in cell wall biosynthesis